MAMALEPKVQDEEKIIHVDTEEITRGATKNFNLGWPNISIVSDISKEIVISDSLSDTPNLAGSFLDVFFFLYAILIGMNIETPPGLSD